MESSTKATKQNLIVKHLCFSYERSSYEENLILKDITFEVTPGNILLVQGDSGVGKSTLLKIIAGLLPVQMGNVTIPNGNIRILFQEPRLFPWLNVQQNLEYALRAIKCPPSEWIDKVDYWLARVGLNNQKEQRVQNLSGGMQQRLALARVMCSEPHILLLDEPFSSLHKELREELWILLKELTIQNKLITLLVSHHLNMTHNCEVLYLKENLLPKNQRT